MSRIIYPPTIAKTLGPKPTLFLAGSIEMGAASDWQETAIQHMLQVFDDITIFNPRRKDWNSTAEQRADNDYFRGQVEFELDAIERCDCVMMWLEPGTLSPISLLELGLLTGRVLAGDLNKLIVGCPEGFWRHGNVEIVTERAHIPLVNTFEDLLRETVPLLQRNHERRQTFADMRIDL